MKRIQKQLIFAILFTIPFVTQAQLDKEVVVRKLKQWEMTDANKINLLPNFTDSSKFKASFDYSITPYQYKTNFQPEPVNPARMLPEPKSFFYGNYFKLGFGSNVSPFAEIRINNTSRGKLQYGILAKHHSAFGKFRKDDLEYYPGFNRNTLQVNGKKFLHTKLITARLGFESNAFRYYGYDFNLAETAPEKESLLSQHFNLFTGGLDITSTSLRNNKTLFNTWFDFYYLADQHQTNELGSFIKFKFRDRYKNSRIYIDGGFDLLHRNTVADTTTHMYLDINPAIERSGEEWKFVIGVNSTILIDPDNNVQTYFYPNIRFDYQLAGEFLISYFGYTGSLKQNFYRNITLQNPYVSANYSVKPTSNSKNIFAGFNGVLTSRIKYNFKASYNEYKNAVLFTGFEENNTQLFQIVHTNMDMAQFTGELVYIWDKKLQTNLTGGYFTYFTIEQEDEAWMKPDYKISLHCSYNIQDKIWINTDFYSVGKRIAKNINATGEETITELGTIYDLNLGLEYKYNKKVAAFLSLNNLLGSKYYEWNHYPVQGFHVMAGLSYAF